MADVAPERSGPVGERERRRATGTESTGVPSSRWHGTSATIAGARRRRSGRARRAGRGGGRRGRRRPAPSVLARAGRRRRSRRASSPSPGSSTTSMPDGRRPTRAPRRSDDTTTTGSGPAAASTCSAIAHRELGALVGVERVGEARLARPERPDRDHDARVRARDRGREPWVCVCYRPWSRSSMASWRSCIPRCTSASGGRSRARDDPGAGPGDPGVEPRLVPRPARARVPRLPPQAPGAVPRQGRAVRQARARRRSCAARTRSRCSGAPPTPRRRSIAAVDALARGECVTVFPEGTISLDLEPMAGKSGTARLAPASGVPVTPVGLWGLHRVMFKGRKPRWRTGVAEVVLVGRAAHRRPGRGRARGDRPDHGGDLRAGGAAPVRSTRRRPSAADDDWWVRAPETAVVRSCRPAAGDATAPERDR